MTALPLAGFTAAQAVALARMEAAEPAPESLRERVARALHESDEVGNVPPVAWEDDVQSNRDGYRNLADAALNVLRGPSARCEMAFTTPYGGRRCDLPAGHDGYHVRNDGLGRPEYHWGTP